MVSNGGISKILQVIVHDGCPSQLAGNKLRGAFHNCEYLCEYSTDFQYCGSIGLPLNIPIRICITI